MSNLKLQSILFSESGLESILSAHRHLQLHNGVRSWEEQSISSGNTLPDYEITDSDSVTVLMPLNITVQTCYV